LTCLVSFEFHAPSRPRGSSPRSFADFRVLSSAGCCGPPRDILIIGSCAWRRQPPCVGASVAVRGGIGRRAWRRRSPCVAASIAVRGGVGRVALSATANSTVGRPKRHRQSQCEALSAAVCHRHPRGERWRALSTPANRASFWSVFPTLAAVPSCSGLGEAWVELVTWRGARGGIHRGGRWPQRWSGAGATTRQAAAREELAHRATHLETFYLLIRSPGRGVP